MPDAVDAVVLAGGLNKIRLYPGNRPGRKALVQIAGKPLLQYTLEAARDARTVDRIIVVAPEEVCVVARQLVDCETIVADEALLANVREGMRAVRSERALYLTADVPLIRTPMIEEWVEEAVQVEGDLIGAIVEQRNLPPYTTHKPFLRFRDGAYQHGNLFMIPRASLEKERVWRPLDRLYRARKNGLRTAAVLGPGLLWWFAVEVLLLHRPTLAEAVARVSRTVGMRLGVVESRYPEIMLDIDEPEDYEVARQFLENGNRATSAPAAR